MNTVHNAYDTFAPYSATDAVGNTMPTMPAPAGAPAKCGAFGAIVTVIVAVILMYVAPVGATIWQKMAIAAISSTMASAAGQTAAIWAGEQEEFNFSAVGTAAVGAAIGAGMNFQPFGTAQPLANAIVNGALANATVQGIAVATKVQEKFEWRNVAAAGIGAGVGQQVGAMDMGSDALGMFTKRALAGFAGGVATAALGKGRVGYARIALDAFGNALGNSIADQMTPRAERPTIGLSDKDMRSTLPINLDKLQDLSDLIVQTEVSTGEQASRNNG